MTLPMVTCPLCCQPGFNTSDSLCAALVGVTTRKLCCPICNDVVLGLDKLTIHLFSHTLKKPEKENPPEKVPEKQVSPKPPTPKPEEDKPLLNQGEKMLLLKADNGQIFAVNHDAFVSAIKTVTTSPLQGNEERKPPKMDDDSDVILTEPQNTDSMEFQSCKDLLTKGDFSTDETAECSKDKEITEGDLKRDGKESVTCDLCSISFPNRTILAMHKQLIHRKVESENETKKKIFGCSVCGKSFKMRGSLMVHRRVAHSLGINTDDLEIQPPSPPAAPPPPKASCTICGKFFKKETYLTQHMKAHEEKKWQCSICSKTFSTKYFLKKHKRLHTGEMPYRCTTCNKTFTFQQSYHKHLSYHNDDKPYCCSQCGRLFKEYSTLQNHERIHSGEKPFSCETCDFPLCPLLIRV